MGRVGNAAKHPNMHRTALHSANVISAMIEKPSYGSRNFGGVIRDNRHLYLSQLIIGQPEKGGEMFQIFRTNTSHISKESKKY